MVSVGIKCWPISDKKSSKFHTARDGELQDTSGAVSGRHTFWICTPEERANEHKE